MTATTAVAMRATGCVHDKKHHLDCDNNHHITYIYQRVKFPCAVHKVKLVEMLRRLCSFISQGKKLSLTDCN